MIKRHKTTVKGEKPRGLKETAKLEEERIKQEAEQAKIEATDSEEE